MVRLRSPQARRTLIFLVALLAILVPMVAGAVDWYPPIICTGLFGCGAPPEDVLLGYTLPVAALIMVRLAAGGAVIGLVFAGVQMVMRADDEGKVSAARKAIMFVLGGLALALTSGSIVSFVLSENFGQGDPDILFGPGGLMASVIRVVFILFNVVFTIVVIVAGIKMIVAGGSSDEFRKAGHMIKWAIIGAIIVTLAKAIVQALLALQL